MSRGKAVRQAVFRPGGDFYTRREVEVSTDELAQLISDTNSLTDSKGFSFDITLQEWSWEDSFQHPILNNLKRQTRINFRIGEEITGFKVKLRLPSTSKGREEIEPSSMMVGSRVIIPVGDKESFELNVHGASQHVFCVSSMAFQLKMEYSAVMTVSYDNSQTAFIKADKPGFRDRRVPKDPSKRYILIIDGILNPMILKDVICKKAFSESRGNQEVADKLSSRMLSELGVEDQIASLASAASSASQAAEASMSTSLSPTSEEDLIASMARGS